MGNQISTLMKQQGFTQETLAKKAGVSQTAIYKILIGETKKSRYLGEIAKALGVTVEHLQTNTTLPPSKRHQAELSKLDDIFQDLEENEVDDVVAYALTIKKKKSLQIKYGD